MSTQRREVGSRGLIASFGEADKGRKPQHQLPYGLFKRKGRQPVRPFLLPYSPECLEKRLQKVACAGGASVSHCGRSARGPVLLFSGTPFLLS
jgi:hypothetical protein